MKRLLTLWLLLPLLSAAKVPVESDIKARIEDPASEQYYPNLRLRYEQADSTLTAEDYHYLYYGYAYQPQYRPTPTCWPSSRPVRRRWKPIRSRRRCSTFSRSPTHSGATRHRRPPTATR